MALSDALTVIAVIIMALVSFVIKGTKIGRRFEAVGANARAARAAGIDPLRYQLGAYVAANVLYCCAAILLAGAVTTPSIFSGNDYLLPTVAAVMLGGTSLLGGVGSVTATAVAPCAARSFPCAQASRVSATLARS